MQKASPTYSQVERPGEQSLTDSPADNMKISLSLLLVLVLVLSLAVPEIEAKSLRPDRRALARRASGAAARAIR